ncbi:hypothetical protein ACH5A7_20945 [Streptomyces sp. NPDC018955]|uniref:hypothetical protein n=1 Tax=Streptomyces sp. NPDC018955 TaxID=3365055 RepID=UPI0037B62359
MPEDTPQGEEQPTMLSFTEAAERLVADGIAQSMTAEGLRKLARDPASGWPINSEQYRVVGKTRMLPYELLAPYMRERLGRRPGRGPAKTKRRTSPTKQQGAAPVIEGQMGSQPLNGNDARAILGIVWKWISDANDGLGSDVGDLQHELESAGYGPVEDASE